MFASIKHTFSLMGMSWRVLMMDRELLFFPVFSMLGLLVVAALGFVSYNVFGDPEEGSTAGQVAYGALFVLAYVVTVFFNAALVSAALERLRGGDPTVRSGLVHALRHIHHIVLWALISALANLILRALERRFPSIVTAIIGGAWELLTFFVVPVIVSEDKGPFGAIGRSASIVRQTWGRQITATFGFILIYIAAIIVAAIPAVLVAFVWLVGGIALGVVLVGFALAVVQALEGVFKAALYDYAMGYQPHGFDLPTLQNAYRSAPA